ncbi:LysR family transcriptional regulator, partial [Streptomyces sp. UNOC14_S4]|uniref:LysR family transcriptional regulator n=1 Tax=Streptomyces sp. UNOC14_S4 TaxID=2872340 RepID=UPI001E59CDCF
MAASGLTAGGPVERQPSGTTSGATSGATSGTASGSVDRPAGGAADRPTSGAVGRVARSAERRQGSGLEIRELECFLTLAEELHFGRTGERLYVSQGRVSQLLRSLESRIGARLVERTSRRVRLTPLGEDFLRSLRPAYAALRATVDDACVAARGIAGCLRIGFQGSADDAFMAVVALFEDRYRDCSTEITEVPLSDPFGPLHRGEVDIAVALLPMAEESLVLGPVFSRQPQYLAVSKRHPFATRSELCAEDLADSPLIGVRDPAPAYWREVQAPSRT